ncbi:kinase-like domain-containing protein [Mycena leptocephala]|nr:kinase-like domain-containing protein [Mycena leptocephala]
MEAEASSSASFDFDHDGIWGYLEPLPDSDVVHRINFTDRRIAIGRSGANYVKFTSKAVIAGKSHATIEWNGRTDKMSVVTITDHNTVNGTFVDGVKVEGINVHRLFDGCTIFFGSKVPMNTGKEDYRFTFRHPFGRSKEESLFHHYTVGDRIGGGLHGTVHRALEKTSGQLFAVKTSWKHGKDSPIACAGQETMALMIMEHTNIVKLHEVFFHVNGELIDMVLEYVDGIRLHDLVFQTHLSEVHARELAFQLCSAIAYVHDKGVSHGDLKLDNVLITDEDPPKIKVIDFGLANVLGTYNMPVTPSKHIFSAPEAHAQWLDGEASNATMQKWDVWGAGCLIFNLLSSTHPFPGRGEEPFHPAIDRISWNLLDDKSDEARDLVQNLLPVDPADRMDLRMTSNHPWFRGYTPYRVSFASLSFEPRLRKDGDLKSDAMDAVDDSPALGKGRGAMQRSPQAQRQPRQLRAVADALLEAGPPRTRGRPGPSALQRHI